jgi:hypothetical protein
MKTTLLSVAHAPQSPGVEHSSLSEYTISQRITTKVAEALRKAGHPAKMVDVGAEMPHLSYSQIKDRKCQRINELAEAAGESLAVELHLQRGDGTAILYWHASATGEAAARTALPILVAGIGQGQHWRGLIPCPNTSYWPEAPTYCPFFISGTDCPALMIELGSITWGMDWLDRADTIGAIVASALMEAAK